MSERIPEQEMAAYEAQGWDFIMAGWPQEIKDADKALLRLESDMEDMLEVAIQQIVGRCKRYAREHDYPFTTFQINKSLIFFNRAVEELAMQDVETSQKTYLRDSLTDRFLDFLNEIFHTMRTDEQRERMRNSLDNDRFPGDVIGLALVKQSMRLLAKHIAPAVSMKRHDYLALNQESLLELINKHACQLNLGREVC